MLAWELSSVKAIPDLCLEDFHAVSRKMLLFGEDYFRFPLCSTRIPFHSASPRVHLCSVDCHGIRAQQQGPHQLFHNDGMCYPS